MATNFAVVFLLYYGITLLVMVSCTQALKYIIRRERPTNKDDLWRLVDMRSVENGTFSMPSGDSAAGAVFCTLIAFEMDCPWIFVVLPLVMAGRIYYHCHWLGDTLAGASIGLFWGAIAVIYFNELVPLWSWICGSDYFIKASSTS